MCVLHTCVLCVWLQYNCLLDLFCTKVILYNYACGLAVTGCDDIDRWMVCEQVLFVYVFTIIPPRLTDPCSFITVLIVTREPEQMRWRFCFETHGHMAFTQPTCDSRQCTPFSNLFSPLIFWLLVYLLFVYLLLFMHQAMCNIIWHLRMCTCLFRCRIELNQ